MKRDGRLRVFFEVNWSDVGMNMSDLMNCIRVILVDDAGVNTALLENALCRLSAHVAGPRVAVMSYPSLRTAALPFAATRRYVLWLMNLQHTDTYFSFMHRLSRFMGA